MAVTPWTPASRVQLWPDRLTNSAVAERLGLGVDVGEFADLNQENQEIWNQNASFWDEGMGEGNKWHRLLIAPAQEHLLALQQDDLVLDIACGNGQFARHMARLGARVIASDFAP
ncbi:MAG: hypothetical protein CL878_07735 [Dehalococcoidia bacterium]|nr:hypothetical protein [Dehalococcoidia bacterium]